MVLITDRNRYSQKYLLGGKCVTFDIMEGGNLYSTSVNVLKKIAKSEMVKKLLLDMAKAGSKKLGEKLVNKFSSSENKEKRQKIIDDLINKNINKLEKKDLSQLKIKSLKKSRDNILNNLIYGDGLKIV